MSIIITAQRTKLVDRAALLLEELMACIDCQFDDPVKNALCQLQASLLGVRYRAIVKQLGLTIEQQPAFLNEVNRRLDQIQLERAEHLAHMRRKREEEQEMMAMYGLTLPEAA